MDRYILVMLGAAFGGAGRYAIATVITEKFGGGFPLGTFVVNVSGSFLIGLLMTLMTERWVVHPNWRVLIVVGVLGGYTTFSSLEFETVQLVRSGLPWLAVLNSVGSVIVGYFAVWLGALTASRG